MVKPTSSNGLTATEPRPTRRRPDRLCHDDDAAAAEGLRLPAAWTAACSGPY